ncbi:hypothetical protein ACFXKF_35975 [Streptomyces scopuliridis]|uniref:hypothetical protein n=1 Tax=Streptomyces scopuliridis TaxID=452529 RepID=UPI0036912630
MVLEERIRSPITRSNTSIASSAATCGITAANATRVARRRFPARSETAWARAARAKRTSAWSRPGHRHLVAAGQGGEVGVGLLDGFGVRLVLGVLGQRPVDAGDGGVLSLALAGGVIRSGWICSTDSPSARRRSTVCSMSSVMT